MMKNIVVVLVVWWIFPWNVMMVWALNHNMRMMPLTSKWTTFLAAKSKSFSINNNCYMQWNPSLSFSRISHRENLFQLSSHKDEDYIEFPMEDNNRNSSNNVLDHRSNIVNKNTTIDIKSSRRSRKTTTDRIFADPRQEQYNVLLEKPTNIWAFENLFPEPVWDDSSIQQDLYRISNRNTESVSGRAAATILSSSNTPRDNSSSNNNINKNKQSSWWGSKATSLRASSYTSSQKYETLRPTNNATQQIDLDMTQRVEGAVYGIRTRKVGDVVTYDTSLMGDGAVKFRDGIRLSNPLKVNSDRLSYFAQREMARNRLEDAQALYEQALSLDPQDGRAYLGLSKISQRRRDFQLARQYLQSGIFNSISLSPHTGEPEFGGNPYLLQALGCLQETTGHLTEAEDLYLAAVKSRPSHAAAWIALAQLRVRKLRMNVAAGRICYQTAERELQKANLPPSAHLYTAWGSLERQPGGGASGGGDNTRKARELYLRALECDPRCSVAYLQLGVLETEKENWEAAEGYFEQVLKFDPRNARVLQAYAIMESKRPNGNSRKVIDLFERALRAKPRDAVVLQAYALYVVKLGDIQSARAL
jgi:tetratricopeptide (TPR) repeat protein